MQLNKTYTFTTQIPIIDCMDCPLHIFGDDERTVWCNLHEKVIGCPDEDGDLKRPSWCELKGVWDE